MNDPNNTESRALKLIEDKFQKAMIANQQNDVDRANKLFREIIEQEPRLAEARLEYAHNLLGMGRLTEAQGHADESVRLLENSGPWLADVEDNVILSMAYSLQGEIFRELASSDEIVFRQPEEFKQLMELAKSSFNKAAALDANNEHAQYWGGFDEAWENPMAALDDDMLNHPIPEDKLLIDDDSSEDDEND